MVAITRPDLCCCLGLPRPVQVCTTTVTANQSTTHHQLRTPPPLPSHRLPHHHWPFGHDLLLCLPISAVRVPHLGHWLLNQAPATTIVEPSTSHYKTSSKSFSSLSPHGRKWPTAASSLQCPTTWRSSQVHDRFTMSSSSTSSNDHTTPDFGKDFPTSLPVHDSSWTLIFNKLTKCTQYDAISSLPYMEGKSLHLDILNELWIRDEVSDLISGIGWDIFFHLWLPAFIEVTHKFYCTFFFHKNAMLTINMPNTVNFRLLGHRFRMLIAELTLH